jgi:hypothetical protein
VEESRIVTCLVKERASFLQIKDISFLERLSSLLGMVILWVSPLSSGPSLSGVSTVDFLIVFYDMRHPWDMGHGISTERARCYSFDLLFFPDTTRDTNISLTIRTVERRTYLRKAIKGRSRGSGGRGP